MDQGAALEPCPGRSQAPRQRSELRDALLHLSADTGQFCVNNEREQRKMLQFALFWENVLHYQLELFPASPWRILKCFNTRLNGSIRTDHERALTQVKIPASLVVMAREQWFKFKHCCMDWRDPKTAPLDCSVGLKASYRPAGPVPRAGWRSHC